MHRRTFLIGGLLGAGSLVARRLLIAGSGGSFGAPPAPGDYSVEELTTGSQAGYCWFQDPRAMRVNDLIYFGNIDPSGNLECRTLNENTGAVSLPVVTYPLFEEDDHDNPSFLRRDSDGHILAFFTTHVGDVYCTIGTAADDITSLTLANTTNITTEVGGRGGASGYTYASAFQLLGEASDPIYVCFRYHSYFALPFVAASKSIDGGANWTDVAGTANSHSLLAEVTYHHAVQNGDDRIDFAVSNHPDDTGSPYGDHGIYHFYMQSGNLYQTDGTLIGAVGSGSGPGGSYVLADLTQIFDDAGGIAWIWDIALDGGNPVVAYVVYEPTYPSGPWTYHRAHWNGSAWVDHEVADAGGKFPTTTDLAFGGQYAGGISIDQYDVNTVYYSSNAGGGNHKVYQAVTADSGATWTPTQLSDGTDKAVRPIAIRGEPGRTKLIWEHGSYDNYFGNYAMDIAAWR
jgi:putative BNR repeat neuraminidase